MAASTVRGDLSFTPAGNIGFSYVGIQGESATIAINQSTSDGDIGLSLIKELIPLPSTGPFDDPFGFSQRMEQDQIMLDNGQNNSNVLKVVVELYSKTGELKGIVSSDSGNASSRGRLFTYSPAPPLIVNDPIRVRTYWRLIMDWSRWPNVEYETGDIWVVYARPMIMASPSDAIQYLQNNFPPEYPPLKEPN